MENLFVIILSDFVLGGDYLVEIIFIFAVVTDKKINIYKILEEFKKPDHWPKSSVYRLQSVRARVLRRCHDEEVYLKDLIFQLRRITRESLVPPDGRLLNSDSLNTYRSVLTRYILENATDRKLKPWEATQILKAFKK